MRNRALHDALRDFALEAAALLSDDLKAGAEVEFDVVDEGDRRGPVLYRYQPRTGAFIGGRWERLRELPACHRACMELGAGAASWLRVNGLRGEQAEPALQAMLERLYEDATSFGFPEERFERVYKEVETTLFRDAVRDRVVAPLAGAWMEAERIDFGAGLSHRPRRPRRRAARGGLPGGRRRRPGGGLRARLRHGGRPAPRRGRRRRAHARPRDRAAAVALGLGEPRRTGLAANRPRPLVGGTGGRHRRRPRQRLAAAGRRGEGAARIRGRDRGNPSRWHDRLGARALRDGVRAPARLGGALRPAARPARPARRHQRRRRGEPRAAGGRALRRGGQAQRGAGSHRVRRIARADADGRRRARAGRLAGGDRRAARGLRARAAARRPVRLPRPGPEDRGRRHPDRVERGALPGDPGARPARGRSERFQREPEPEPNRSSSRSRSSSSSPSRSPCPNPSSSPMRAGARLRAYAGLRGGRVARAGRRGGSAAARGRGDRHLRDGPRGGPEAGTSRTSTG